MRYLLHGTSLAFICIGTLFDFGILFYADRLKGLYDEDEDDDHPDEQGKSDHKHKVDNDDLNSIDTPSMLGSVLQDKIPLPVELNVDLHELNKLDTNHNSSNKPPTDA